MGLFSTWRMSFDHPRQQRPHEKKGPGIPPDPLAMLQFYMLSTVNSILLFLALLAALSLGATGLDSPWP